MLPILATSAAASVPTIADLAWTGKWLIFALVFAAIFVVFMTQQDGRGKKDAGRSGNAASPWYERWSLQDRVRRHEQNLKSLALKKRETENEINKLEIASLDDGNGADAEVKIERLRLKMEQIDDAIADKERAIEEEKDKGNNR